jgi:hypothetical protein
MLADAVRDGEEEHGAQESVREAQRVEVPVAKVEVRAQKPGAERHRHEEPVGGVHDREARRRSQRDDTQAPPRRSGGEAVHKVAVQRVLLEEAPHAVERDEPGEAHAGDGADGAERQPEDQRQCGDPEQERPDGHEASPQVGAPEA